MKKIINYLYPKYELHILSCNEAYLNERSLKLQDCGWRITGPVEVRTDKGHLYASVAFKRKLK